MKCIKVIDKKTGEPTIIRVTNEQARHLVMKGLASYASKQSWKARGRQR